MTDGGAGSRSEVWALVHEERRALAADLDHLEEQAWRTASLCPEWDVHDVLAHLVDSARTTRLGFARRMLVARMDFDRDNADGVRRERRPDPRATLDAFRAVEQLTCTPPAPLATRLVEAVVHGEDIRRPLGVGRGYPQAAVLSALAHQLRTGAAMGGGRERVAGWELVATDASLVHGTGPRVEGPALELLLAASGRPARRHELSGAGADGFVAARG